MTNLKISNCDKTQKLKSWQNSNYERKNSKTQKVTPQIVTKLEKSNGDKLKNLNGEKTQKLKLCQKLKLWWNSNCDETQELKKWRRKNKMWRKKLKLKMWQNLNCDKTWKLKLWQNSILRFWENSETKIVTKVKYDNFQFMKKKTLK